MSEETYLERMGFRGNPFASTNSENEESLAEYFVPPPYFESVLGSPVSPKTTIVFAPRGSGKTAQRRMIEIASAEAGGAHDFVCVTYSNFSAMDPRSVSLIDHLSAICRLLTTAALSHLEKDAERAKRITEHHKQILKYSSTKLLNDLNQQEMELAISSVKSVGDRAGDIWHKYGGFIATAVAALMSKYGIDGVSLPKDLAARTESESATLGYLYPKLVEVLTAMGFKAVYVLVDKVDETGATGNNPAQAFNLIRPLIMDLSVVERPNVAFKFFLWDQLEDMFIEGGGRSDRLGVSKLHWTVPELAKMLTRRLEAFSNKKVGSFNELVDPEVSIDVHQLLSHLSPDSPRDMIRMCEQIVSEHTRQPKYDALISENTVVKGIHEFSKVRSRELFGKYMKDLLRLPEPSFTISQLASGVFKITNTAVRNKIVSWTEAGAVEKIGEVSHGGKPTHQYALRDPRVALSTVTLTGVKKVLGDQLFVCHSCGVMRITGRPSMPCHACGVESKNSEAPSLLSVCSKR